MIEHSMHEQPPPGRRGHQEWNDVLKVQSVSMWQQTGDADEHQRRQSSVLTQVLWRSAIEATMRQNTQPIYTDLERGSFCSTVPETITIQHC